MLSNSNDEDQVATSVDQQKTSSTTDEKPSTDKEQNKDKQPENESAPQEQIVSLEEALGVSIPEDINGTNEGLMLGPYSMECRARITRIELKGTSAIRCKVIKTGLGLPSDPTAGNQATEPAFTVEQWQCAAYESTITKFKAKVASQAIEDDSDWQQLCIYTADHYHDVIGLTRFAPIHAVINLTEQDMKVTVKLRASLTNLMSEENEPAVSILP